MDLYLLLIIKFDFKVASLNVLQTGFNFEQEIQKKGLF